MFWCCTRQHPCLSLPVMNKNIIAPVHIIGDGLAGSEAAWQLVRADVPVILHEMRPERGTDEDDARREREKAERAGNFR